MELEIRNQVVVSTAHMASDDGSVLDRMAASEEYSGLVRVLPYGWELVVSTGEDLAQWEKASASLPLSDGLLQNMMAIWKAVSNLHSVIMDRDGPMVEGLLSFDW